MKKLNKLNIINLKDFNKLEKGKFYVYVHYKLNENKPFYIGKGKKNRCINSNNRTSHWNNIVNNYEIYVKLISINLSEEDALKKEKELISYYGFFNKGGYLVNVLSGGGITNTELIKVLNKNNKNNIIGVNREKYFGKNYMEKIILILIIEVF